jgi:hypothetical protein
MAFCKHAERLPDAAAAVSAGVSDSSAKEAQTPLAELLPAAAVPVVVVVVVVDDLRRVSFTIS